MRESCLGSYIVVPTQIKTQHLTDGLLLQSVDIRQNSHHWRRSELTFTDLYSTDCEPVGSLVGHIERL
jgi:hypothetical protein